MSNVSNGVTDSARITVYISASKYEQLQAILLYQDTNFSQWVRDMMDKYIEETPAPPIEDILEKFKREGLEEDEDEERERLKRERAEAKLKEEQEEEFIEEELHGDDTELPPVF